MLTALLGSSHVIEAFGKKDSRAPDTLYQTVFRKTVQVGSTGNAFLTQNRRTNPITAR
jgi:hypothetical protein